MDDIIHNSALRTMRECEQKYKYRYVEGLGEERGTALNVGTWFHTLMHAQGLKQGAVQKTLLHDVPERIYFGLPDEDTPSVRTDDVFEDSGFVSPRLVHEWITSEVHAYWPEGDDEIDAMPDNVWFLYERYMDRWAHEMVREEVLGVEVEWQRSDMPDFEGSREVAYGGQADRIVRRADGLIVVRDHKTTSSKPSANFRLTASQLHLYAWGLHPWLSAHGVNIDAVEYDYALTYWPSVRLTKSGNLYKNQKVIDLHAARVLLTDIYDVPEGQEFPERFHDWLAQCAEEGNREFFPRHTQPINETVISQLLDEGAVLLERMHWLEKGNPAVRNTGRQCDWCPFADVCAGDLLGNDTSTLKEMMK